MWQLGKLIIRKRHLLCARLGLTPEKAPASYVRPLFDDYAQNYDDHLTGALRYNVPVQLRDILGSRLGGGVKKAIDLGCGTGLCGPLFRDLASHLIGVDLSPKMPAEAQNRAVYDELVTDDLVTYLQRNAARFDLCLPADVFVYIGDLHPTFRAVVKALVPGGCFAFYGGEVRGPDLVIESDRTLRTRT